MSESNLSDLPDLPPEKGEWDQQALARRNFLQGTFAVLATVGVLHIGIPAARFLVGNSLEPAETKWVELGAIDSLPADQVTRVNYSVQITDAWREVTRRGTVYVYSLDGGATYEVLDATCTHLGCIVRWREDKQVFGCPCHSAVFSQQGEVISGPPPEPLHQLATKIVDGKLFAEV